MNDVHRFAILARLRDICTDLQMLSQAYVQEREEEWHGNLGMTLMYLRGTISDLSQITSKHEIKDK